MNKLCCKCTHLHFLIFHFTPTVKICDFCDCCCFCWNELKLKNHWLPHRFWISWLKKIERDIFLVLYKELKQALTNFFRLLFVNVKQRGQATLISNWVWETRGAKKQQQMNSFRKLRWIKREQEWFNNNWWRLACSYHQAGVFFFISFSFSFCFIIIIITRVSRFHSHLYFCVLFRFICHLENKTEKTHTTSIKCLQMCGKMKNICTE